MYIELKTGSSAELKETFKSLLAVDSKESVIIPVTQRTNELFKTIAESALGIKHHGLKASTYATVFGAISVGVSYIVYSGAKYYWGDLSLLDVSGAISTTLLTQQVASRNKILSLCCGGATVGLFWLAKTVSDKALGIFQAREERANDSRESSSKAIEVELTTTFNTLASELQKKECKVNRSKLKNAVAKLSQGIQTLGFKEAQADAMLQNLNAALSEKRTTKQRAIKALPSKVSGV